MTLSRDTAVLQAAPRWDRLDVAAHEARLTQAMTAARAAQDAAASEEAPPTFENTIVAIERLQDILAQATEPLNFVTLFDGLPERVALKEATADALTRLTQGIFQDARLWARVQAVYDQRESLGLPEDAAWLLEQTHRGFRRAGAHLSAELRTRLQDDTSALIQAELEFGRLFQGATNTPFYVTDASWLAGLSPAQQAKAAQRAQDEGRAGAWSFSLSMPNVRDVLTVAEHPSFRQALWHASAQRSCSGEYDTTECIRTILRLRSRIATTLGFDHWAALTLHDTMAGTPERAEALLMQVWTPMCARFQEEARRLEAMQQAQAPTQSLTPADWFYWARQHQQQAEAFDAEALRDYLPRQAVRQGLFDVAQRLFEVTFEARPELPVFAPRVESYLVRRQGEAVGLLYLDDFQRPTKGPGAWMDVAQSQSTYQGTVYPVGGNCLNLTDSSEDARLTAEEVITMFHELGHGLHGLLSQVRFPSQSGLRVPTDFMEVPSQLLENWARQPEVFQALTQHYVTGERIPDALLQGWLDSRSGNTAFGQSEYLFSALMDLKLHQVSAEAIETLDLDAFAQEVRAAIGAPDTLAPRYPIQGFLHIFHYDYSARYYAYQWSAVLEADAFSAFQEQGVFDPATAQKAYEAIYSRGHSRPAMASFQAFMGREPRVDAYMRREGLMPPARRPAGP